MRDTLDNFLKMVDEVLDFFIVQVLVLTTIAPAAVETVEKVKTQRAKMTELLGKRGGKSSGQAESKNALQRKLADKATRVLNAVHWWAHKSNDPDLAKSTELTVWKLLKLRDKALVEKCKAIHDLAEPLAVNLTGVNITADDIDYLITGAQEYSGKIVSVGTTMKGKSASTDNIDLLEHEMKETLDHELDSAMTAALGEDHKDLLALYEKNREIIDYGIRHEDKPEENTPVPPAQ